MSAIVNIINRDTEKARVLESYRSYPDTQPEGFEQYHASTVEPMFCEIPEGSRVLDIGCNSGEFMKLLKDAKNCDVYGIDMSEVAIKEAKKKGLKAQIADAENLPFSAKRFDVVIMREVLVHIHDPQKAIQEVRRVLKDKGVFLGSTPHANLERFLWDDQRGMHHRYFDETKVEEMLGKEFPKTHIKVLTGAQFSSGMAMSHLSDKPAEILWKAGKKWTKPWDHALLNDTKTLRVWMGPTQPPGDVYYRMVGFGQKMREMKDTEIAWDNFSWKSNDGCAAWQEKVSITEDGNVVSSLALDSLEKCLRIANPWVFQVTYSEDVLTLFETLKDLNPGKKLVTECDDWMFDIPAYNVASHPYKPGSEKERIAFEQLKLSDAIIVSTPFLKESLSTLFPEKPIHVIPNAIDFDVWDNAKSDGKMEPKKDGVVRIIYSGCGNHSGDLEIVKPVLLKLLDEYPNLEVLMSAEFECFKDVTHPRFKVVGRWVDIMSFPSMVKGWDGDIGIAPLRDNAFNRAKSNLRWLEYSALGLPSVMSDVRPFSESVSGETGILCKTRMEWFDALKDLIEDKGYRESMGENAYKAVRKNFNMGDVARIYRGVLEDIKRGTLGTLHRDRPAS